MGNLEWKYAKEMPQANHRMKAIALEGPGKILLVG